MQSTSGAVPDESAAVRVLHRSVTVRRPRADARNRDVQRPQQQTVTLAELLRDHTAGWQPPHLGGKAIARTTATSTPSWATTRTRRAARRRGRPGRPRLRMLRVGRQLRLRGRALRRVPGLRRAGPAARRAPRGRGHPGAGGRVQLPHPDRTGRHRPHAGAPSRDTGRQTARRASTAVPPHAAASRRLRSADRDRRSRRGSRCSDGSSSAAGHFAPAASAGRMTRPPSRQAGTGSPFSRAIVRAPRRGPHGSRSRSRTPTAAWLMRSTPPAPRPSRACAPMATPDRDWLPARHHPPGRSATMGITSHAQPCHTRQRPAVSHGPPQTLLSLDLCV